MEKRTVVVDDISLSHDDKLVGQDERLVGVEKKAVVLLNTSLSHDDNFLDEDE